ncbi:MAG: peptide chain release factor N(5)-glutamine methyltransferase, partial [Chlorobiales bacterium]|nr:peptide chain release factor N(5)-glutamine methyltransferase [Chlorobiales bacterium]
RRLKGEPLQYITGEQEFFGYPFFVDRHVLIPRPETELLVEAAIEALESISKEEELRILDIGTGSGCIGITLAKKLPNARITAIDLSGDALGVARKNAEKNEVSERITFIEADALSPDFALQFKEPFDLIISNPPYIPAREAESLQIEVRNYEPHTALFVAEGFEFYEKISHDALTLLKPGGHLFFELHADGAARVKTIFERLGFSNIQILKDYSGILRMAFAQTT